MPSLIGSAPNQVPTNGMLGTMAFQDADTAVVSTKDILDNSTSAASTAFVKTAIATNDEILLTTGTSTAYQISPTIPITSYVDGYTVRIKIHTNNTGSSTLSVSGLAAQPLQYENSSANQEVLEGGFLKTSQVLTVRYKTDRFIIDTKPSWSSGTSSTTNDFNSVTPKSLRMHFSAVNAAPLYACRAWIKFNGTGTPSIIGSGNFSSITDNGTGNYTLNFTTSMPDDTYSVVASGGGNNVSYSNLILGVPSGGVYTTAAIQIVATVGGGTSTADAPLLCVAIFR